VAEGATMGKQSRRRSPKAKLPEKRLLYNISPANGGLVFAEPERAQSISRIHEAISRSSTWEEFRRAMPRWEYSRLIRKRFDERGETRPRGSDKFDEGQIPGYCDGDYPDWLQQEMEAVLPEEILEEFAEGEVTMLNGTYDHIDPKHLPAIKARLEELGYVVEDGTDLSFY
jgi:hypothetical protein